MGIKDRIGSIDVVAPKLKVGIYGPPGSGKTVFAATSPSPLIVDVEFGTRSLLNHSGLEGTEVISLSTYEEVEELLWDIRDNENGYYDKYETIVIDTFSELQKRQMDDMLKYKYENDTTGKRSSPYLPVMLDYKENTETLRRILLAYRDLDKHLILVAHDTESKDDTTGEVEIRPSLTPKLASTVEGILDVMGYLTTKYNSDGERESELQVRPQGRARVKTRLGGLPIKIVDPTFDKLLNAAGKVLDDEG